MSSYRKNTPIIHWKYTLGLIKFIHSQCWGNARYFSNYVTVVNYLCTSICIMYLAIQIDVFDINIYLSFVLYYY